MDSVIGRLKAKDDDSGDFGVVTYFLDQRSTLDGKFKIHPETGELSIAEPLDREK